ncbi:MAG: DsrE/DsrF/DrsH-like family protein [Sulfolobales archaeon]
MSKISIIIASERIDKLYPAATLAVTAANMGWESEMFFTFWGLLALKKNYVPNEVSSDYKMFEDDLRNAMVSGALLSWNELIMHGKKSGKLKIYACSTTMSLLNIKTNDLVDYVDGVVGAATFLNSAKDSNITLFIS